MLCSSSLARAGLGEGSNLLAEPEPGFQALLPQILSDGSGGVAPAWHVTLLLNASLPRSVKAEACMMRRPVPGILEMKGEGCCCPLKLDAFAPFTGSYGWLACCAESKTCLRPRQCEGEQHAQLRRARPRLWPPRTAAADLRSYFDPVRPVLDPWRDESRRPEGGAPVASSLLQKELLVACH